MPATPPATSRVTVESASRLVAVYASRWGLTGRTAPAVDWTFTVEIVADLKHEGGPAWAVVDSHVNRVVSRDVLPGGAAHVQIRDIDATPIPGFDGDAMLELRVTVAHEMGHPVVAEALAMAGGAMTVPAEEHIVETAAQAIVRSEGTADARVMARAVRGAVPSALRARVAARAPVRARGDTMDPEMVMKALDALEGGDSAAALEILKGLIAAAAASGSGAAPPESAGAPGTDAAKLGDPPPPGGGAAPVPPVDARRAKDGGEMDKDMARARKAATDAEGYAAELKAMIDARRPAEKEGLIGGLRARIGAAWTPAVEKDFIAEITPLSFPDAQKRAAYTERLLGGTSGQQRARSGIDHLPSEGPTGSAPPTVAALRAEGYVESWLTGYDAALRSPDASVAHAYLEQGRQNARARKAQTGGAS